MASKSAAFLLSLNLLLFSAISCHSSPPPPKCPPVHVCAGIFLPPFSGESKCCPLLGGLVELEAVVCLCTFLTVDLGIIQIHLDLFLNLILNACGRKDKTYTCTDKTYT
ncbi:hypothetical protein VNO80_29196 [Phaseolus coccineus]|uniref:Bifunctional inhibitor/plant lipid transfer protein/seed storage helical domain-containing protein n=1 Tax=Phaseolus coccineus TaxID=3886 RepID=A0AAN9LAW6_PHACN